jgi:CheY-like chemotaxis protein
LVVDDIHDNRVLIETYLSNAGAEVCCATNGMEGVSWALREHFDVVLMDLQMPKMDGIQAVIQLRRMGYNKPVVALTADGMKGDRERSLKAGSSLLTND